MSWFASFFRRKDPHICGYGLMTAKEWCEARAGDDTLKTNIISWVHGCLSGIAIATNSDFLSQTTPESILAEMDRRCALKPLATVAEITVQLAIDLKK